MSPFVQGRIEETQGEYSKVIVNYKLLEEDLGEQVDEIVADGYLNWKPSRLDLLAILHKSTDTE